MTESGKNSLEAHNDEIDLIELVKVIWSKRLFISKVAGIFLIFGLVIAFTSPKEYETSCTLIPEAMNAEGKLGGSLGGLAALAGVDLGSMSAGSRTINPNLYQSVAKSTPFLLTLLEQRYLFRDENLVLSIREYYLGYYKESLLTKVFRFPFKMMTWLKSADIEEVNKEYNKNIISISKEDQAIIENLKNRILVTLDYELSVVTVEVEMQDPMISAEIAQFTQAYITDYATDYSVSKSREQLSFVENQYSQRRADFEEAQSNLAHFRDNNRNINTSKARSEEERLQSEYNLAFNIFNQLAQQRETIKLQVNENTPVFTVLEPVKVPVEKSKPRRVVILLAFIILGVIFSIAYTLIFNRKEQ
ncbi:MAG: hypothetical protein ACI8Q1_001571 [Parvicella sp.]|jgi:uncharacterized protein involved in exopolysaccharide biosynthesis